MQQIPSFFQKLVNLSSYRFPVSRTFEVADQDLECKT